MMELAAMRHVCEKFEKLLADEGLEQHSPKAIVHPVDSAQ